MLFAEFWRASGEPPFDALTATSSECYRLRIETSLAPQHRIYRVQQDPASGTLFVAHFFVFGATREEAAARTHVIALDEPLWSTLRGLLTVAKFWELPRNIEYGSLDGAIHTLEAWDAGRKHEVVRSSPDPFSSGGELFAVVTDYLERLGQLAILECDAELRNRYVPDYVPIRHLFPRGNMS